MTDISDEENFAVAQPQWSNNVRVIQVVYVCVLCTADFVADLEFEFLLVGSCRMFGVMHAADLVNSSAVASATNTQRP